MMRQRPDYCSFTSVVKAAEITTQYCSLSSGPSF